MSARCVCKEGAHALPENTLFIDCSAGALDARPAVPVFQGDKLVLQAVKVCQQVFSAAVIAKVESLLNASDEDKNDLTEPVPHPETREDLYLGFLTQLRNTEKQKAHPEVGSWLGKARLNNDSHLPTVWQGLTWAASNWRELPFLSRAVPEILRNGSKHLGSMTKLKEAAEAAKPKRRDTGISSSASGGAVPARSARL